MNAKEVAAQVDGQLGEMLRSLSTDYTGAMGKSHQVAFRDGEIAAKHKELIALAVAVTSRCEGCVVHHARAAVQKRTTRAELLEVLAVTIQMGGGPATIYASKALAAYDAFAAS